MKNLILFTFLFSILSFNAQNEKIDSLNLALKNAKHDTTKADIYLTLAETLFLSNPDTMVPLCKKTLDIIYQLPPSISKLKSIQILKSAALSNVGYYYKFKNEIFEALEYYDKSLEIALAINDKESIAKLYSNSAVIYDNLGDIEKSLDLNHKSLLIREEIGDKKGIALSLNNLGFTYSKQGEIDRALENYLKSLAILEEIDELVGLGYLTNNVAKIYNDQGKIDESIKYNTKSLEIREKLGDKKGIALSYNNIGTNYRELGDTEKAIECFNKSISINKEIGDNKAIIAAQHNLALMYFNLNDSRANSLALQSFELSKKLGYPHEINKTANLMTKIYRNQKKYKDAFETYELEILMRDSIKNEINQKATVKQQLKYDFDKKIIADSLINAKKHEIQNIEIEKQNAEIEVKRNQQNALLGGLFLVFVFAGFMYNRFRVTNKQKKIIEQQKAEVENKKQLVEEAHCELKEKNKEITDSIQYAKRIQAAILPPNKLVKEYLQESFILYKPKDIVAGDFYWLENKDGKILFAAADCTGHGVPGAMVSVVCNNGLNRSVREHGLTSPDKILNKTREIVINEFEKSEEEVKDGMDISICSLDVSKLELEWAGANNPLWIVRNNEIIEFKADKQPIGKYDNAQPFTNHTIQLQKSDTFYIFTDGFVDQFGGQKGKKFLSANFKKLLLSIQDLPLMEQKEKIDTTFENWKIDEEQVDDVCIIGVRI